MKKMVALHGKGGDAASFARYLAPLVEATSDSWEWEFLDGPHDADGGRAWWNLPPGVRTFEASELDGIDASMALLDAAWPFDGVFGFSQGAMLAAVACGRGLRGGNRPSVAVIVGAASSTSSTGPRWLRKSMAGGACAGARGRARAEWKGTRADERFSERPRFQRTHIARRWSTTRRKKSC